MAEVSISNFGTEWYVVVHTLDADQPKVLYTHTAQSREDATTWLLQLGHKLSLPVFLTPKGKTTPGYYAWIPSLDRYFHVDPGSKALQAAEKTLDFGNRHFGFDARSGSSRVILGMTENTWTGLWRFFILFLIAAGLVLVTIGFYTGTLQMPETKDQESMRGAFTLILLVSMILLIVVVILGALFTTDTDDAVKRVNVSKEVLTPLLGILGTIVGFYFGASTKVDDQKRNPPANVKPEDSPKNAGVDKTPIPAKAKDGK